MPYSRYFIVAGMLSLGISLLHIAIIFAAPEAYVFFGAGQEMADADAAGSWTPDLLTLGVAVVFMLFAMYAFSGAGLIRKLPLLKLALIIIAIIYTLRGLVIIPDLMVYFQHSSYPFRNIVFSTVSLFTGLAYTMGIVKGYPHLSGQIKKP
jgi:hypothetical protein